MNFSETACTSGSDASTGAQGKHICPGEDFFGFPLIIIPDNRRLPQWFFFSDFGSGRYFLQNLRYAAAQASKVLPSAKNAGCHWVMPS